MQHSHLVFTYCTYLFRFFCCDPRFFSCRNPDFQHTLFAFWCRKLSISPIYSKRKKYIFCLFIKRNRIRLIWTIFLLVILTLELTFSTLQVIHPQIVSVGNRQIRSRYSAACPVLIPFGQEIFFGVIFHLSYQLLLFPVNIKNAFLCNQYCLLVFYRKNLPKSIRLFCLPFTRSNLPDTASILYIQHIGIAKLIHTEISLSVLTQHSRTLWLWRISISTHFIFVQWFVIEVLLMLVRMQCFIQCIHLLFCYRFIWIGVFRHNCKCCQQGIFSVSSI